MLFCFVVNIHTYSTIDLLVESLDIKLTLEIEPLFCTVALYDVESETKISENFHFTLNQDTMTEHMVHFLFFFLCSLSS